jgi:hypothetical protein
VLYCKLRGKINITTFGVRTVKQVSASGTASRSTPKPIFNTKQHKNNLSLSNVTRKELENSAK